MTVSKGTICDLAGRPLVKNAHIEIEEERERSSSAVWAPVNVFGRRATATAKSAMLLDGLIGTSFARAGQYVDCGR